MTSTPGCSPVATVTPTTSKRHGGQVAAGHVDEPTLLREVDGRTRTAETGVATGLDLDEHQRVAFARDDVDFAPPGAVPARKNWVPATTKLAAGQVFPVFSK